MRFVHNFGVGFCVARFYSDGQREGLCVRDERLVQTPRLFFFCYER